MPKSTTSTLTPAIALAHERLYPRVTALLAQVEKAAGRHAQQPVPAATLAVAQDLFRGGRKIIGREAARLGGGAAADLGALAVGLGQLRAALEAFEAANSGWSARARCTVWRLDGPPLPVTRLKPPASETARDAERASEPSEARKQLARLIIARFAAGYDEGYSDGSAGSPPSSRYAEEVWDGLVRKAGDNDEKARLAKLKRLYGTTSPPPHLMPVGAKPGEWVRIMAERQAADLAERQARWGTPAATE